MDWAASGPLSLQGEDSHVDYSTLTVAVNVINPPAAYSYPFCSAKEPNTKGENNFAKKSKELIIE